MDERYFFCEFVLLRHSVLLSFEDCKLSTKLEQEIQNFLVEIRDSSKIGRMFLSDSYNSLKVNVSHTSKIQLRYTKKEDN